MNLWKNLICGTAAVLMSTSVMAAEVLLDQNFNGENPTAGWTGNGKLASGEGIDGSDCLKFDLPVGGKVKTAMMTFKLDVAKFKGKKLKVEAMMKGKEVTKAAKPYLGPKLMIYFKTPEKPTWSDQQKAVGDFDWKKFTVTQKIPDNILQIDLIVGFQECQGTLWIDNIKINALE